MLQQTPREQVAPLVARAAGLTRREQQIAVLALQRLSATDIAKRFLISPHTVHDHLKSVFDKLDLHSRGDLADTLYLSAAR